MAQRIYLQTENPKKLAEYQRILGRHCIEVLQADVRMSLKALFSEKGAGVIAVMCESSNLYPVGANSCNLPLEPEIISDESILYNHSRALEENLPNRAFKREELTELRTTENQTYLQVALPPKNGETAVLTYRAIIEGFIAPHNGDLLNPEKVFGWDDRFATTGTQMTYEEMRERGLKLSGRDRVLAQFTRDHLRFRNRRDLLNRPQRPTQTIDFRKRMADFVQNNPHLNHPQIHLYGAQNSIVNAINQGAYWQAAINRREGIYWNPGGNSGVPFTPKINKDTGEADEIHETEFLVHDLGHRWMCPDLVFEGDTDPLSLRVQITWRMMSEALTLVNGSMLYMDTVKKSGRDYDYSRRKIHPLFESLKGDFANDPKALKALFKANVRYALRNDDRGFQELGADREALESYKRKYHAYFVEDYFWTGQNIRNMAEDAEKFRKWQQSVKPLRELKEYLKGSITVSECISELARFKNCDRKDLEKMSQDELIELIFEYVYQTNIGPALTGPPLELDDDLGLKSGFLKYMTAQLYIFDVFDFIPESALYKQRIVAYMQSKIHTLTQEDIDTIRGHYAQFVDILFNRNAITEEDQEMYKEIFPHFPPHYIYYDRSAESYQPLDEVSKDIWAKLES